MARPEGTIARLRACGRELQYRAHQILTPDGVRLGAQDWGSPGSDVPALLLIHGFSQSHGAWLNQLASPLSAQFRLVSYDLRGHGESDKPAEAHFYREPARWAAEVQAVIDQLQLGRPIAVAWSYAGRVILDYLGEYGDRRLAGLVMVNASSTTDPAMLGPAGPFLRRMADPDSGVSTSATRDLLRACVARPLPADEFDFMFDYNMKVPSGVRAHMIGRPAEYQQVLQAVRVPALVVHGALDPINLPAMAAFTARHIPGARTAVYGDAAHMPFWESPQRFNDELAQFVRGATAGMT